jgi:site-specific DNA-methyltransferase (adenine-specific)
VPVSWNLDSWKNKLFFGDNLSVMKTFPDEFIDLVYLDPPFNSNRNYNVIFKTEDTHEDSEAQIRAFDDTWHWTYKTEEELQSIIDSSWSESTFVDAIQGFISMLGKNDATAYLIMLSSRLIEMKRLMKPSASIFLHCDQTMSHYIKVLMDQIFGIANFRNEIIWHYSGWNKKLKDHFESRTDSILFYAKKPRFQIFNSYAIPWESKEQYLKIRKQKLLKDEDGREYVLSDAGDGNRTKRYLDEAMQYGRPIDNLWNLDKINNSSNERLGYPTQKPLELLERIIEASSNSEGIVLDPFCGCGTTIDAAQKLNRHWIGIDITHLAITLIKYRLAEKYGSSCNYEVHGEPIDVGSAKELAQIDRMNFQIWACGLIGAKPRKKKGADKGIDGDLYFYEDSKTISKALVQVKSGHVKSGDIRDLKGTIQREKAPIGIFITLEPPTRDMIQEAATAGFYTNSFTGSKHEVIQIYTIEELLGGRRPNVPLTKPYHKQAVEVMKSDLEKQKKLF